MIDDVFCTRIAQTVRVTNSCVFIITKRAKINKMLMNMPSSWIQDRVVSQHAAWLIFDPEDGDDTFHLKACLYMEYKALYPRRQLS
jgi:hypothetical protein